MAFDVVIRVRRGKVAVDYSGDAKSLARDDVLKALGALRVVEHQLVLLSKQGGGVVWSEWADGGRDGRRGGDDGEGDGEDDDEDDDGVD